MPFKRVRDKITGDQYDVWVDENEELDTDKYLPVESDRYPESSTPRAAKSYVVLGDGPAVQTDPEVIAQGIGEAEGDPEPVPDQRVALFGRAGDVAMRNGRVYSWTGDGQPVLVEPGDVEELLATGGFARTAEELPAEPKPESEPTLADLTVDELRGQARAMDLPTTGSKAKLIERIEEAAYPGPPEQDEAEEAQDAAATPGEATGGTAEQTAEA